MRLGVLPGSDRCVADDSAPPNQHIGTGALDRCFCTRRDSCRRAASAALSSSAALTPSGCEHAFVSIRGSPYAHFRQALDTGNLALIRTAVAELPQINLDDALRICLVIREREPGSFDRPACRWLA